MALNPDATGFTPFNTASSAVATSSKLQMPEKPPADASPEVVQKFKEDLAKYVHALKMERERMTKENEDAKKQQEEAKKHNYAVETVYADEVGYADDDYYYDEQGYFDDFGANDDDDDDDQEEEFIDDLQAVDNKDAQPASQYQGKDLSADELFRIAKTGRTNKTAEADFFGIEAELVARTGFDMRTHLDSFNRTVLHFAAEGGSTELVTRLRKELGESFLTAADTKQLHPWNISVLCRQVECAKLLIPAAGVSSVSKPEDLESEDLFCRMLEYFSPKTATSSLAFGAKPPTLIGDSHKVWGNANADSQVGTIPKLRTQSIQCSTLNSLDLNTITAYEEIVSHFSNNRKQPGGSCAFVWQHPLTSMEFASRDKFSHIVAAFETETNTFSGAAVFSALGMLAGPKVPQPMQGIDNYTVSSVAVTPSAPPSTLHAIMLQSHVDYKGTNVFVRTAAKLPMGNPVAQCKWMYRIIKPWNLLSHSIATGTLCPLRSLIANDYEKFSSTSMVDLVLRQAIGSNFPVPSKELESWEALPASCGANLSDSDADQIANCVNLIVNSESAFGVHWNGFVVRAVAAASDLRFVIRRGGANGGVSDVILFRMAKAKSTTKGDHPVVAILTGMWCPSVARGRRAVVASSIAGNLVGADVIFATNTFGLSNADLTGAFFEDLAGSIEKIYSLSGVDKVSALPAAPTASGVYVPFL